MFPAGEWPLHITVVPPFEWDGTTEELVSAIPRGPRIPVVAGERAQLGSRRAVEVTLIEPSEALLAAHVTVVDALEAAGARIRDRAHIRDGYRPHATVQRSGMLHPGESAIVDAWSLVDRAPEGMRGFRRVVARLPLAP